MEVQDDRFKESNRQGTEIGQGITQDGWGDQGVFVGYACQGKGNTNPELYEEVGRKGDKLYRSMRLMKLSYYAAYIYYLFNDMAYPESVIMKFFESLTDIEPTTNETIRALRKALLDDMQSPTHKMTPKRKEKLIMKAWNAYVSGKTIQRLTWNPDTEAELWFKDAH